jgi:hypothetical protein
MRSSSIPECPLRSSGKGCFGSLFLLAAIGVIAVIDDTTATRKTVIPARDGGNPSLANSHWHTLMARDELGFLPSQERRFNADNILPESFAAIVNTFCGFM